MAVIISGIATGLNEAADAAIAYALKKYRIAPQTVKSAHVVKRSVDARKRGNIVFSNAVRLELLVDEQAFARSQNSPQVQYKPQRGFALTPGKEKLSHPPVIAGFGPAGMFAALLLARYGYAPIVLERGADVDTRVAAVEAFWKSGRLDPATNVQFGEGGAGTFSDGKLTTRINDPLCDWVLQQFVHFGAPKDILYKAKPHIGTDYLRKVVKNIRKEIIALGGQVHFLKEVQCIGVQNGRLSHVVANGEEIPAQALVLAVGHSARNTIQTLYESGVEVVPKAFSVGVRIEHRQEDINRALYGPQAGHPALPPGEYTQSLRVDGRGVYTFCMCPGGLVVPAASEEGMVVTNGMSNYGRNAQNANSALVVGVTPEDFGLHPLDGIAFQRKLEKSAFLAGGGGYKAPMQTVCSFLNKGKGLSLGRVSPSYALGVTPCDFHSILPPFVCDMLKQGLAAFDKRIHGFAAPDAVMTGVETRTSSPVRIPRLDNLQAAGFLGLYPCGEGAGYAGGIMSAAVDGIKVASAIIQSFQSGRV